MKTKIISISRFVLIMFVVMGILAASAGCSKEAEVAKTSGQISKQSGTKIDKTGYPNLSEDEQAKRGSYETAESRLAEMQLIKTDGNLELYLDAEFAEFAVVDKSTGNSWFSNPYDLKNDTKASPETKYELQSLLALTYYDAKGSELTMNSFSDCTSKDQYEIEQLDNGFVIKMQMGRVDENLLCPETIDVSKYEKLIEPKLNERDKRKFNNYYTAVSLSDDSLSDSVKKTYLKESPGLKDHDFYILRSTTDREKRIIEEIIKKTDYSYEDMSEDKELSGHESEKVSSALFNISMYVTLENGKLKVDIPSSSILYDKTQYYLSSFEVLKYFGAGKYISDGYLFVPDGSGALIDYNNDGSKKLLHTTNTVYGMDYSLSFEYGANSLSSQIYFPVYGNKENNKAIFAVIEEGSALATVISESGNILTSYETVYPQFAYESTYTVNYTDGTKINGLYTYHDTNSYTGNYVIEYSFLSGDNANYVGMADVYRNHLLNKGLLKKTVTDSEKPAFYLETLGVVEKTSTKFGIPYTESVPFTTFSQAENLIDEITAKDKLSIGLRYKGWANGGLYNSIFNKARVEGVLGGKKELTNLENYCRDNGVSLYPDADFFIVHKDGFADGYKKSENSAHTIKKELLYLISPQEFTNFSEFEYLNYSVSPNYFTKYADKFFKSYNKLNLSGISIGNMGTMLYSEYKKSNPVNREEALNIIVNILDKNINEYSLLVDGGNAYTLKYADALVNVPAQNSSHTLEDSAVPFMQLVLHGYKSYSGTAINLNSEGDALLKCIEYGSSPFFTVVANNSSLLSKTSKTYYYAVDWNKLSKQVNDFATEWAEAYKGLNDQKMVNHSRISETLTLTQYENGTAFYVNYGETQVDVNGITIPAKGYVRIDKQ